MGWGGVGREEGCWAWKVDRSVARGGGMRVLDDGGERQKKKREKREVRRASGLLPHLLLLSVRDHAGMFNLRHQSQDVMGFDSPFLTPSAVDLTL